MRGLVFTLNRKNPIRDGYASQKADLKYFIKRYGSVAFFTAMLIAGLTIGSIMCNRINNDTIGRLDFFFTTNIAQRIDNGAQGAFCAGFASNFLFFLASFLMGFSLWGVTLLPFIVGFKGFGIGISAGYLFINYGFKGVVFYLAVLLPGIFIFSMALIYQSAYSCNLFKKLFKSLFAKQELNFSASVKIYLQQSFTNLLLTLFAAILDMVLWYIFAGLFNF